MIDYRVDQYIEYDEYLCYRYILDYSNPTQRLHFAFNLFDLNGSARIDRDKLKRTVAILIHDVRSGLATGSGGGGWEAGKEVGGLLELYGYWAMQVYDRDNDRGLRWEEWRQYGEEDDRVRQLCDEMSSRTARRRERLLRQALTQPEGGGGGGKAQTGRDKAVKHNRTDKDEKELNKTEQRDSQKDEDGRAAHTSQPADEQHDDDSSSDDELDDSSDDVYAPTREWDQRYLRDTEETGVWEEYRNRMRTAAGRITTHTMESMEGEALPQPPPPPQQQQAAARQQQQQDGQQQWREARRCQRRQARLPVLLEGGRAAAAARGGVGGGRRSPGPNTSGPIVAVASSPILNTLPVVTW